MRFYILTPFIFSVVSVPEALRDYFELKPHSSRSLYRSKVKPHLLLLIQRFVCRFSNTNANTGALCDLALTNKPPSVRFFPYLNDSFGPVRWVIKMCPDVLPFPHFTRSLSETSGSVLFNLSTGGPQCLQAARFLLPCSTHHPNKVQSFRTKYSVSQNKTRFIIS